MREEYRTTAEQYRREQMRLGALMLWDKGDVGNSRHKRNAIVAMARYKGHTYAHIGRSLGISGNRARQIALRVLMYGVKPLYHAEAAGAYLAEGNYDCTKTYLSTESLKKLITYCEALK